MLAHRMTWGMAASAMLIAAFGGQGCRERKHRTFVKSVSYNELATFEGNYEVVSRKESAKACNGPLQDATALAPKFSRFAIKDSLGTDALFFFDCTDVNTCDIPDAPLFVPYVRDANPPDHMAGELERQAVFSDSRQQCYLSRKEVTLKRVSPNVEYQIVDSEGLFPVAEADCKAELATEKKADLACTHKVVVTLKNAP